jgi:hypothetical protein
MPPRFLAVALFAASAIALAACGDDPAPTAADAKAKNRQAELKFAKCMRDHGINFPDPVAGNGGRTFQKIDARGTTPEKMKAAEQACAKYRKAIRGPQLSAAEQQEFKRMALANARCMREHGIDMPDPTFGSNGQATIKMRAGAGGIEPDDPRFKAAQEACEKTMPKLKQR